jgi:hypothetical protein
MLCRGLACQAFAVDGLQSISVVQVRCSPCSFLPGYLRGGVGVQAHHTRCAALIEVDESAARAEEVAK